MRTWWKQFMPFLLVLSLLGNLFLAQQIYRRDRHLNLVTWGNYVSDAMKYTHWASSDLMPRKDGRVVTPMPQGIREAEESLERLRSLPHYEQRVSHDDMRSLMQFLRYAREAYNVAAREQGESGQVSPESARRLRKVSEGLTLVVRHQERSNQLKTSPNPWNHSAWQAVWKDIAAGLREMEFVPLPQ